MKDFNTTQLHPDKEFERHIFHRDQFAHYLRWCHVLKLHKIGMNVLDIGCGEGNLCEVLYRNKHSCNRYIGIDIHRISILKAQERFKNIEWSLFMNDNFSELTDNNAEIIDDIKANKYFDIITCFEVLEHIGKKNLNIFLNNIKRFANKETIILISTPCYDAKTGAAENHIINGEIQEYTFIEMQDILSDNFEIIDKFGTFASQKDYKPYLNEWQKNMFEHLTKYYDSNLVANLMAPFFPEHSRNCLWQLRLK